MKNIYLNYSASLEEQRNIYFIIDLIELKITKIFKDSKHLETLEPSYYLMCYKCPIYRGKLVYIAEGNHYISFKSFANQILKNTIRIAREHESVQWTPNFDVRSGDVEVVMV